MKTMAFALRNTKEILRDKINLIFGIGFPIITMLLLWTIQRNVPVSLFPIEQLAPGMAVFGLSFISLFSGMLISKDRTSSFMLRLFTSPMRAVDFIMGYVIPLLPMAIAQIIVCLITALFLGLTFSVNMLMCVIVLIPTAIMFIAIGLLCGSVFNDKAVGGVCGALLTNLCAWLSGIWFDVNLVGGGFKAVADIMPFSHAVNSARLAMSGNYANIMPDLLWVIGYAAILMVIAIIVFTKKMNSDNK